MIEFENKLSSYLVKILEGEKSAELLRQALARIPQFTPYTTFKRIDKENKKFITMNDLKRFFYEVSINFTEYSINEFFCHFDRDRDYIINYQEYLNIILTQNDLDLRAHATQRDNYPSSDSLGYEVEYALVRIFEKELNLIDMFSLFSQDLRLSREFSVTYAFRTLDYFKYNFIESKGLEIFLKSNGYLLSPSELKSLVFRLDRDGDGKITFSEFEEIFYLKTKYEGNNNTYVSSYRKNEEVKSMSESFSKTNSSFLNNTNKRITSPQRENVMNSSILRDSFKDINLKASMDTYTSPRREYLKKSMVSEQIISPSRQISSPLKVSTTSPLKTSSSPLKRYNPRIENLTSMNTYTYSPNKNTGRTFSKSPIVSNISPSKVNMTSLQNFNENSTIRNDLSVCLTRFLAELIQAENKLEAAKENFSLQPDICINELYKIFDFNLFGYFGILDFKDGLKSLDVFSSLEELKLLFKRYDLDHDGKIGFNEFSCMVSPKKYEYLKLIQRRLGSEFSMSYESKFNFIKLLRLILDTEQSVDLSRQFLSNKHFFNTYEAYDAIKGKFKNYIIKEDFRQFLYQNSCFSTALELDLLFDRFDKDKDGRITFEEFIQEVLSKNN